MAPGVRRGACLGYTSGTINAGPSPRSRLLAPASCDTLVALGPATRRGHAIFAKNSDRPPGECQPLVLIERATHAKGARVRCQYLDVAQVRQTHRVLGSSPVWLWGFEHGLNEHGVAIGNETIFTHEAPAATGLLGMDLVRFGLERGATAAEACQAIIELIETHGQGGSGWREFPFAYNSSFLLADPGEGWILEAAGRRWAARRVHEVDSISNQVTIAADWQRLSRDAIAHARDLPGEVREPFDFEAAYRDATTITPALAAGRLRCSRSLLAAGRGDHDPFSMRRLLRDHDGHGERFRPVESHEDEQFYTLCMHQGLSRTTAAMLAELEAVPTGPRLAWIAFGRPCASVFLPVFVGPTLPAVLTEGTVEEGASLWWDFERLGAAVDASPDCIEALRAALDPLQVAIDVALENALRAGLSEDVAFELSAALAERAAVAVRAARTLLG